MASEEQVASISDSISLQAEQTVPFIIKIILQDLRAELLAGSIQSYPNSESAPSEHPVLHPNNRWSSIPAQAGKTNSLPPNLLKQSAFDTPFFPSESTLHQIPLYPNCDLYPASNRAGPTKTTTPSLNGRTIPLKRWNLPGFLPREYPDSPDNLSPALHGPANEASTGQPWHWAPPDWVLLQRNGETPSTWLPSHRWNPLGDTAISHRFAYQIYDAGGLLDLNVAGFDPASIPASETVRRGSVGLADLSHVGFRPEHLSKLVHWRNAGTLTEPDSKPFGNRYLNFLFSGPINQGFLRTANLHPLRYLHKTPVTNRAIPSRSALINLVHSLGTHPREKAALTESLQYLTHFSRSIEQPSAIPGAWDAKQSKHFRPHITPPAGLGDLEYTPNTAPTDLLLGANYRGGNDGAGQDEAINPPFLSIRTKADFRNFHGDPTPINEPLVHSKFPLSRLNWITSNGPSGELPKTHLQYNAQGTREAIYAAFGLRWDHPAEIWQYDHSLATKTLFGKVTSIGTLTAVRDANREADFFELLKAAITAGSLGKAAAIDHPSSNDCPITPKDSASFHQQKDRSIDLQILQIGANLIDQYDADSFPTLIGLQTHPQSGTQKPIQSTVIRGIEDLPYFYRLHIKGVPNADDLPSPESDSGHPIEITTVLSSYENYRSGSTSILALPELWNPHSYRSAPSAIPPPSRFRCIAVSEDPEGYYGTGSGYWQHEHRFQIRPNVAFAAMSAPNQPAAVFFSNKWPLPNGPPSIPNEIADSRGFWRDIYKNLWDTSSALNKGYAVQCYPFFRLPNGAHPDTMPSEPSDQFHVDHYYRGVQTSSGLPRFFAFSEKNSPLQTIPAGTSYAEVDVRGTELLFQVNSRTLFREPTTLCKPGHPAGSDLKAGPNHWLSSSSYPGKTKGFITEAGSAPPGAAPETWLGFSMGERPTAWLMAAKLVNNAFENTSADQYGWDPLRGPREKTGYMGSFLFPGDDIHPPEQQNGTGKGWYTPSLLADSKVSLWRFFQIPANTVNILPTLFTIRLQYQTDKGKWVTYDEHYIQCEGDFTSRFDFKRSPKDQDGSGKAWFPADNQQRSTPLPWSHTPPNTRNTPPPSAEIAYGHPLVSSYDPRTSRFGHPVSPAFVGFSYLGILPDWPASRMDDRWIDPMPNPDGVISGLRIPNSGPIPQQGATSRPSHYSPLQTATLMVPGGYANTLSDPTCIGWFPNQIRNPVQTKIISSGVLRKNLPPLRPPRFAQTPWFSGGQPGNPTIFRPGWLSENQATPLHQYYADADDIVRRATGAYAEAGTSPPLQAQNTDPAADIGHPQAQSEMDQERQNRPIILNRAFRSVAEMGYTFRGTPWKHLDFFTPESGDAALLDVFTVIDPPSESPLVAGKVNLNTSQVPVLKALLAGALKDELHPERVLAANDEAERAALALIEYTHGATPWTGPLTNLSELISRPLGKNVPYTKPPQPGLCTTTPFYTYTIPPDRPDAGSWSFGGFPASLNAVFKHPEDLKLQRRRESVIRALVDCGQVRVWNLMVDLIVQSGKYPKSATSGADFAVTSENRVWLHLALDRCTGEILDQQTEWISE